MLKKYLRMILLFILFGLTLAFSNKTNIIYMLIITGSYFLITIIYTLIKLNRFSLIIPEKNQPRTKLLSIILSLIIMIIFFIINRSSLSLTNNIVESLSIFIINIILTYPINPIKYTNEDNVYKTSCTNTILTETIPTPEELTTLKKLGITIIIFNKKELPETISSSFKEVSIKSINTRLKKYNLHIKEFTKKDINKINNLSTYLYTKKITDTIAYICKSRGEVDNLVRTIKINDIISYSLSLLLIVPIIFGFPPLFEKNLLLAIVLLKQFLNIYLIPNMERDYDVLRRKPRIIEDKIFTGQEIMFNILSIIAIVLGSSIIYMSTLTAGSSQQLSMSLVLNIYLYSYIFIILINLSESLTIINIFKSLKDLCTLTIILLLIIISLIMWYLPLLGISRLNFLNYRSCIIIALIITIWFDITKIARYFRRKKVKHA